MDAVDGIEKATGAERREDKSLGAIWSANMRPKNNAHKSAILTVDMTVDLRMILPTALKRMPRLENRPDFVPLVGG